MRYALAAMILAATATPSIASMPRLTPLPSPVTLPSCQQWASAQDEDAFDMWGIMESGNQSKDVAVLRLTLSCLGDVPPAIVGFGSSAGGDAAFCKTHKGAPICRGRR